MDQVIIALEGQQVPLLIETGTLGLALKQMADTSENAAKAQEAAREAEQSNTDAEAAQSGAEQARDEAVASLSVKANKDGSDISSAGAWRSALELGDAATRNVGSTTGTVAAGDDDRLLAVESKAPKQDPTFTGTITSDGTLRYAKTISGAAPPFSELGEMTFSRLSMINDRQNAASLYNLNGVGSISAIEAGLGSPHTVPNAFVVDSSFRRYTAGANWQNSEYLTRCTIDGSSGVGAWWAFRGRGDIAATDFIIGFGSGQSPHFAFDYRGVLTMRDQGFTRTVIHYISSDGLAKFSAPIAQELGVTTVRTPSINGEMVIEATSNTTLTFKLKGADGVVRSASLTLS